MRALVFCSLILFSIPAYADTPRMAPLHIRMDGSAIKKTGIRIHLGKIPKPRTIESAGASKKIPGLQPSTSVLPAITAQTSCAMNRKSPMLENRIQNMADSLKNYMQTEKLDPDLIDILHDAAQTTQTDFELLVIKAMLESDLGRHVKSPVSTARGVFQYIETTWLTLMHRYGGEIGYPQYAAAIEINAKTGEPEIKKSSPFSRSDILEQRYNPYMAAMIKALQMKEESAMAQGFIQNASMGATDHYILHMLGMGLAEEFYRLKNKESADFLAHSSNPLFREAVALNRAFFYDTQGHALNAGQAYDHFTHRIANAFERLRKIEVQYGKISPLPEDCAVGHLPPSVTAAKVDAPEMLPVMGLSIAMNDKI